MDAQRLYRLRCPGVLPFIGERFLALALVVVSWAGIPTVSLGARFGFVVLPTILRLRRAIPPLRARHTLTPPWRTLVS
jgi:hypothetical protein